MGIRRGLNFLPWLLCLVVNGSGASEPAKFAISQVSVQLPEITVYLDVVGQNGAPPASIAPSDLSATLQGRPLKVTQVMPFEASHEGVAYVFLVDISKSIAPKQFGQIQQAIEDWVNGLSGNDRMAIFTFGESYQQLVDFTADKETLLNAVKSLKPTDRQTKLHLALKNAMDLSRRADKEFPSRRVVVVLSDGKDEGSGLTVDDVRSLVERSHLPIYAIGSSRLPSSERQEYLDVLNRFAIFSGGSFRDANTEGIPAVYKDLKSAIRRVFVAKLVCDRCQVVSQSHPLEMTLTMGTTSESDHLDLYVIALPPVPPPLIPRWAYAIGGLLAVFVVVLILSLALRKKDTPTGTAAQSLEPQPPRELAFEAVESRKPEHAPGAGISIRLTTVTGRERGRAYELNLVERAVLGRGSDCDLTLADDVEISGRHCELVLTGGRVEVRDLGSANGTLLNGASVVARQRIEDGDLIRLGRTELRISIGGSK